MLDAYELKVGLALARDGHPRRARCATSAIRCPTGSPKLLALYLASRSAPRDVRPEVFFERRYSEADGWRRLVEPSGPSPKRLQFVGEGSKAALKGDVWELIPWSLGPLHPALSAVLHDGPRDSWRDVRHPALAFLVLQK